MESSVEITTPSHFKTNYVDLIHPPASLQIMPLSSLYCRLSATTHDFFTSFAPAHQQLKTVFRQRGINATDDVLRRWIDERDTSGTGAVDFKDFSRAFVVRHVPIPPTVPEASDEKK